MAKVTKLTHERLTKVLAYDPATGVFTWKIRPSHSVKVGARAGVVGGNGHRLIGIDGERFQATRLAWFYAHARWPEGDIIPENGDLDDIRINNLCDRPRMIAARGRKMLSTNKSGFRGVSKSASGRWQASLTWGGKQIGLGTKFATPEEASEVYEEASRRLLTVATVADFDQALTEILLWRRQRAAWREIERSHPGHLWESFEQFCRIVKEVPRRRWAVAPVDVLMPLGPANWRWSIPADSGHSTAMGKAAYRKIGRETNKAHERSRQMQRDYGIDAATYAQMLRDQRGVCACCGEPETKIEHGAVRQLAVDHDHATDAVRALLCNACNLLIGYAGDDVAVLQRAIAYLRRHSGESVKFEPSVIGGTLSSGA